MLLRGVLRAPFYALSDSTLAKVTGTLARGNKLFAAVLSYIYGAARAFVHTCELSIGRVECGGGGGARALLRVGDYGLPPSQASFAIHACTLQHYEGGAFYPVGVCAV